MAKSTNKLPIEKAAGSKKPVPVKIVHDDIQPKVSADYEARERKYKAEDALRDIERAEGHKRDRGLMRDVKKLAKDKIKSLGKI